MRRTRLVLLAIASLLVVTACNTVEGVGKDIKSAGESIEGAAKK